MSDNVNKDPSDLQGKGDPTISIDGKAYVISMLREDIRLLIALYQECEKEQQRLSNEAFKQGAAARAIGSEVEKRIRDLANDSATST